MSKIIVSQGMINDGPIMMAVVLREVETLCSERGLDPQKLKENILSAPTVDQIQGYIDEFFGPDLIKIIFNN